ncbi:hypothetical protein CFN17_18720 [Arthrobacter sp. PM3]|nr:hypothetical protein CFN17_18720 [Arthrobacter sp. PM3]
MVIYRNDEFVAGLIQQIFNIGLPIDEMRETIQASVIQQAKEAAGAADAETGFNLPWTANAKAKVSASAKSSGSEDAKDEQKNRLNFQYTQANFLHNVRQQLHNQNLIRPITGIDSLQGVEVGSFVEFAATFEANEINSILDLATPELVAAVTRWQAKKDQREKFDYYYEQGHEELQKFIQKSNLEAESRADLAAAATQAVRQDFRNETTREYFGKVVGGTARRHVTAVTICDTEHFASQDKDRILDGTFTVLGKVSEVSMKGTSILSRNKVLNRIQQPMLDELKENMHDAAQEGKFNTSFKLGLKPPIVKVIPIAIYV